MKTNKQTNKQAIKLCIGASQQSLSYLKGYVEVNVTRYRNGIIKRLEEIRRTLFTLILKKKLIV